MPTNSNVKKVMDNMPVWLAELCNDVDLIPSTVQFEITRVNQNPSDEKHNQENVPGNFREIKIVVTGAIIFTGGK